MNDMVSMDGLLPDIGMGGRNTTLGRRAKAAIVVRLLLTEGAEVPLEELPEDLQTALTVQMGSMRAIDRDTLAAVAEEFAEEVERVGLAFPDGIAGALDALDGTISRQTAVRLRKEAGVRQWGNPWAWLRGLPVEKLLPLLESESIEVSAVMLSKLPVALSAELLGKLPGPRARHITYAMSLTEKVTPDAVDRIGLALAAQIDGQPPRAFDKGSVTRLGAILNSSTTHIRDDVLSGLEEADMDFAEAVRKAIFTFGNIPERIKPGDIPRVMREVDQRSLVTAMAGAAALGYDATTTFILENMSNRMASQLRDSITERGKVRTSEVEEGMAEVIKIIRDLEETGELELVQEDEAD